MNVFDLVLVLLAASAAVGGAQLGFVSRATSWFGLAVGVTVAVLLLPEVVPEVEEAGRTTVLLVAVGLATGAGAVGLSLGLLLGRQFRTELAPGPLRRVDKVAGGLLGVTGVLVVLWLLLPILAHVPGRVAEQARGSAIAREVDDVFPDPPDTLGTLRRFLGDDAFPQVFDALRQAPDAGTVPAGSGLSPEMADQVVRSTVKVTGRACARIQTGSGFFVDDDLVVTNAHVVAGESTTRVELAGGVTLSSEVVAFDPQRDLAVLRTDGEAPPLPLREAVAGDVGGVFGYPGGGDLAISPFRVAELIAPQGRDIYDRATTTRDVLVLASELAPGDSGSALVDPSGQVVGVAFAVAPDQPGVAYALAVSEVREVLGGDLVGPAATGDCLV